MKRILSLGQLSHKNSGILLQASHQNFEMPAPSLAMDTLIVSNGLKLRMFSGCSWHSLFHNSELTFIRFCGTIVTGTSVSGVKVLEVSANVNNVLLRIGKEGSTVETCRPDQTNKFLVVMSM